MGFGGRVRQFIMPALITSVKNGNTVYMTEMRKITALVPAPLLEAAQACTGEGVTETLRQALQALANKQFGREELRRDRAFDDDGKVS